MGAGAVIGGQRMRNKVGDFFNQNGVGDYVVWTLMRECENASELFEVCYLILKRDDGVCAILIFENNGLVQLKSG